MIQSLFDQTVTDTTLIYSIMSFQYFIILNYEFYYLIHKQNELTSRLSIYLSIIEALNTIHFYLKGKKLS